MQQSGQLCTLDAQATLDTFMAGGEPQWKPFHEVVGGLIARTRLQFPAVRAYGGMLDILWQAGRRDPAIRLEELWNELARLQTFSLFCAYFILPLEAGRAPTCRRDRRCSSGCRRTCRAPPSGCCGKLETPSRSPLGGCAAG